MPGYTSWVDTRFSVQAAAVGTGAPDVELLNEDGTTLLAEDGTPLLAE